MKRWPWFFATITILIVSTMVFPRVLGLMQFAQWGGMYTDGWCQLYATPGKTNDISELPHQYIQAGKNIDTAKVWYFPMHNAQTCLAWAYRWCSETSQEGWQMGAIYPYFRGAYLMDSQNICRIQKNKNVDWFPLQP